MNFHFGHLLECREMKVSLNQYLGWEGPLTHRQCSVWSLFRLEEFNRPSRSDQYLMQLTATVARILAKNPSSIKVEHYQLTFKRRGETDAPMSEEEIKQRIAFSKGAWLGHMGGTKGLTIKDADGNIIKRAESVQSRVGTPKPATIQPNVGNPLLQRKTRPPRRLK